MKAVTLERRTRRLVQYWTTIAVVAATAAMVVSLAAGGDSSWVRLLLGMASLYGFARASRFRAGLHLGTISGILMVAIVPQDATVNRGVVAAVGAVLILLACESAHIARRLITIAPVQTTRSDARALAQLVGAAAVGVAVTGAVAQVDRWSARPLIIGLPIAGLAVLALLRTGTAERT
jgi:hypothetical protein